MGLLDYIFKSKEQKEKEAKEAEENKNGETFSKANKLYQEGKDDEGLRLYMQLVNKRYRGTGFWYAYIDACSILWKQKRYAEFSKDTSFKGRYQEGTLYSRYGKFPKH